MDQKDLMHQMIKFNQTFFDNAFDAAVKLQDQAEKIGNTLMDQADWLPGESRKFYDSFVGAFKAGRSSFKSYVDESYQLTERFSI